MGARVEHMTHLLLEEGEDAGGRAQEILEELRYQQVCDSTHTHTHIQTHTHAHIHIYIYIYILYYSKD
jgi:hypothetical protein